MGMIWGGGVGGRSGNIWVRGGGEGTTQIPVESTDITRRSLILKIQKRKSQNIWLRGGRDETTQIPVESKDITRKSFILKIQKHKKLKESY